MSTDLLELAIDSTRSVLANVVPEQFRDPTPCTKWNVSQLINHVIGDQFYFSGVLVGEDRIRDPSDFSKGNFLSIFDTGASLCVEAFGSEGVMGETFSLFSSETSGPRSCELPRRTPSYTGGISPEPLARVRIFPPTSR